MFPHPLPEGEARRVTALINARMLSKTDDGMIVFPYDAIHVDFMLKAE